LRRCGFEPHEDEEGVITYEQRGWEPIALHRWTRRYPPEWVRWLVRLLWDGLESEGRL
jgi:hypothetical protein